MKKSCEKKTYKKLMLKKCFEIFLLYYAINFSKIG